MKKIFKTNNKKGFTLLEVMLAVAILAITSTMIMNGFIASMTYSTNTSIFSRAGSNNYSNCMTYLATHAGPVGMQRTQFDSWYRDDDDGNSALSASAAVTLSGQPASMHLSNFNISVNDATALDTNGMNASADIGEGTSYVANRHSFFYVPGDDILTCPQCGRRGYVQLCQWYNLYGEIKCDYYCRYVVDSEAEDIDDRECLYMVKTYETVIRADEEPATPGEGS